MMTDFIKSEYKSIQQKLSSQQYETHGDYSRDLQIFRNYLFESGPAGPSRGTVILEHLAVYQQEAAELFIHKLAQESRL